MLARKRPTTAAPVALWKYTGTTQASVTVNAVNNSRTDEAEARIYVVDGDTIPTTADDLLAVVVEGGGIVGPSGRAGCGPLRNDYVLRPAQTLVVAAAVGDVTFSTWGIPEA